MNQELKTPLFLLCIDSDQKYSKALAYACRRATEVGGGRVGIFRTMDLDDFQNWASVEDTMKQELRTQSEKDLWDIAGYISDTYRITPEFFIEDVEPMDAFLRIAKNNELREIVVSASKSNLTGCLDLKRISKSPAPIIFVPEEKES